MTAEFRAWEQTLPWPSTSTVRSYPHLEDDDGLPQGWQACWLHDRRPAPRTPSHTPSQASPKKSPQTTPKTSPLSTPLYTSCVVRRSAGGWGMVFSRGGITHLWLHGFPTVGDLYVSARGAGGNTALSKAVPAITAFIVSRYDLADEAEAAEATVVGLGGPVTVLPRSLTT